MIKEYSNDIKHGCKEAEKYFEERREMRPWELGGKYWWISYRIPKLQDIVSDFHASRASINETVNIMIADALQRAEAKKKVMDEKAEQRMQKRQRELTAKLKEMQAAHDADRKERKEKARNTEKLVDLLLALGTDAVKDAAMGTGSGKKCSEDVVNELVKGGMDRKDAKAKLEGTLSVVRSEKKNQKPAIKRAKTDEALKGEGKAKASSNAWILCVDSNNRRKFLVFFLDSKYIGKYIENPQELSIIAHTYLEFVRAWTMNTQKYWLFQRVDSAGAHISTGFSQSVLESEGSASKKADASLQKSALTAIAGGDSYFRTKDAPDEKGTIMKIMQDHQPQGLDESHFTRYEHIICFGAKNYKILEKLKEKANQSSNKKAKADIHHVKECDWFTPGDKSSLESKEALLKVTGQIKVALKKFLKLKFDWEKPGPGIADGEWRTALLSVSKEQKDNLRKDQGAAKKKIFEKTGCRVQTNPEAGDTWRLAISGPKDKLAGAEKRVRS
jgi:hypothetical protein